MKRIARDLLSASERFEKDKKNQDIIKTLAEMSGLEDLARASLPNLRPEPVSAPVKEENKTLKLTANPSPPSAKIEFSCSNTAYSDALKDPSLVKALIGLSKSRAFPLNRVQAAAAAAAAHGKPGTRPNSARSAEASKEPLSSQKKNEPLPSDFRIGRLQRIDATPKTTPIQHYNPARRCSVFKPGSSS